MRTSSWLLFLLIAGACKGEPFRPDAKIDAPSVPELDAFEPPWWSPMPGEAANWDIQLAEPINVATYRAMYDVDLWQVTPATTITYADTTTVMVPAGPRAALIDMIHAKTPRPIVVCYLRIGTVNLVTDPDRMRFPGFQANPPDNPTPPVANSVIGWSTNLPLNERWLDIRAATRGAWAEVVEKRIQLAKDIGCDAIDLDRTIPDVAYGFGLPNVGDMKSFLEGVAGLAHTRVVAAGFRGTTAGLSDQLDDTFDFMVIERCAEDNDCEPGVPLTRARKAVFAIDYEGGPTLSFACSSWANKMFDGILKQDPPAGNFRMGCP